MTARAERDPLTCICELASIDAECPVHSSETGPPLPKYSLLRVLRALEEAKNQAQAMPQMQRPPYVIPLLLALYHLVQYIRAKERGEV